MNMNKRIASVLVFCSMIASFAGCSEANGVSNESSSVSSSAPNSNAASNEVSESGTELVETETKAVSTGTKTPKYVFLFIGDGMSYLQYQAASDYLGVLADADYMNAEPSIDYEERAGAVLDGPERLNFMNFETVGSAITYDSCSFAPDSASTATSISTGHKTYSGMINVDETGTEKFETIAEKLHEQKNMKIGVISSVNLNHATPAAFYAHQASRNNYYEIGLELVDSGFEYFAGGGLKKIESSDRDQKNLYTIAEEAGYKVTYTQDDAEKITADDEKVILIDEHLADSDAMDYELDRQDSDWALANYVSKGIEVLDNDNGFFMMCEGGKIDWACHANDAGSTVSDVLAFSDAVQVAVDFAAEHPDETLILVTGDHETGGLTIGFAGTDYDTYLTNLSSQKISFTQFDEQYIAKYKEEKTSFEDAMKDVEELFGLKMSGSEGDKLVLTEYEIERLRSAYELAMTEYDSETYTQEQYVLYGTYNPFSVTITHILNNKSGIDFTSYSHTGLPVGVFAEGVGAADFDGYYDNTEIYSKMAAILGVE